MMDVTLTIELDDIIDDMSKLARRQVPYAAYRALNNAVFTASMNVRKMIPFYFQGGAVPFTKRGVRYTKAPDKRNLVATVYIPEEQWKYLMWMVEGGTKKWLKSKHGIGKPIYKNVRFNKYGNIPGRKRKEGAWREILNQGKNGKFPSGDGKLGKNEFIAKIKGVTGLWKRVPNKSKGGSTIKLMIMFAREAEYGRPRFPFHDLATSFVRRSFETGFNREFERVVNRESKKLKAR